MGAQGPIRLATVDIVHQPYPHKTVQRAVFEQALSQAQEAGADEPLLLSDGGFVAETARFAMIWEDDDGKIGGPPIELGILPSVGRARVAELCGQIAERASERTWLDGRPVALVNAVRGMVQVSSLDGTKVPQSALLDRVAERFWP
jgi:branched-subunit amino acid aminotransferase/4-amino-4-deoxychorismate lyase